jgi:hypothetical protein
MIFDTAVVLSCSTLNQEALFDDWAWLVERRGKQVAGAIRKATVRAPGSSAQRERWNATVDACLAALLKNVFGGRAPASELRRSLDWKTKRSVLIGDF